MRYDPSTTALYNPERQGPLFGAPGNWTRESRCAELARLAYIRFEDGQGQPQALQQALALGGFHTPATFNVATTDAQGYATIGPDGAAYIAFRGTQPDRAQDIANDADAIPVAWPGGGRVHRGFKRAFDSIFPTISPWLAGQPNADLVVTGHSLGAAMATLLAARLRRGDLITFGSPLVGNADFAALFAGRPVRRFVDCCDVVARVPAPVGYRHLEGERYIDKSGQVLPAPPGFIARHRDQVEGALEYLDRCSGRGNAPFRELADHAPVNYLSAVLEVREGP
jgi:hypothetical protein